MKSMTFIGKYRLPGLLATLLVLAVPALAGAPAGSTVYYIPGDEDLMRAVFDDPAARFEVRGFSAFPRGYWDNAYYAAAPSDNGENAPTDIYTAAGYNLRLIGQCKIILDKSI